MSFRERDESNVVRLKKICDEAGTILYDYNTKYEEFFIYMDKKIFKSNKELFRKLFTAKNIISETSDVDED